VVLQLDFGYFYFFFFETGVGVFHDENVMRCYARFLRPYLSLSKQAKFLGMISDIALKQQQTISNNHFSTFSIMGRATGS